MNLTAQPVTKPFEVKLNVGGRTGFRQIIPSLGAKQRRQVRGTVSLNGGNKAYTLELEVPDHKVAGAPQLVYRVRGNCRG